MRPADEQIRRRLAELSPERRAALERLLGEGIELPAAPITRRAPTTGTHPLSYAQERLWFLEELHPGAAYNLPFPLRLNGRLDVSALEQALDEIVRRHETLRTTFGTHDGRPVQVIAPPMSRTLAVTDLAGLPPGERELRAQELATADARRPFDLARGPLLRASLLRLGPEEHVLLLTMHHIVTDGWSMDIFRLELQALYAARVSGQVAVLAEPPIQYVDYALWQRESLQGPLLSAQLGYWRERLGDAPAVLELPADRPRPAVQSFRGASVTRVLSSMLSEALRGLSQREGVTLFMTLLAAFQTLLHRYTGQSDISVGSPIAGRTRKELEGLIGFFVNTLVLRTDVGGDPAFRELLGRVKEICLGAYAHQEVPFEKLVAELAPERRQSHTPLFQVMFGLQNMPAANVELGPLRVAPLAIEKAAAPFDVTLYIADGGDCLYCLVEYSTDLFERETIARWLASFEVMLEAIVADPGRRLSELPLLPEPERRQVVVEWNRTPRLYPGDRGVHELVAAQAAARPDAIAVIDGDEALTYQELMRRASEVSAALAREGVKRGELVGVCLERSAGWVVTLLGVLRAGAAYVPLDPTYPAERLAFMVADAGARVVITTDRARAVLPEGTPIVDVDAVATAPHGAANVAAETGGDTLAYVMYTSGSTGRPKGVAVPHRAIARLVANTDYLQLGPTDVVAQASNAAFDAATFEVWGALVNGGRLVVVPGDVVLEPDALGATLERHEVTVLFLTTALLNACARTRPRMFGRLRALLFGGEAVDPRWVREVCRAGKPERVLHVYGPTETTTFATWHEVDDVPEGARTVPIGRPIANTTAFILDSQGQPVPVGVAGELYLGGPGVADGYWQRPGLTAERFVPDRFSEVPGARLYRTGDLVRWRADGAMEFLGRLDQQVKIRGFRVEPGEIEAALGEQPEVRDAVVVPLADPSGSRRLVAYVVPADGMSPTAEGLRAALKRLLPEYLVPATWIFLPALPLTANGKVDRAALPVPETAAEKGEAYAAPRSDVERALTEIWAEVLGVPHVGIHDSFFDLGGHSLLATQVMSRLRETFGVEMPLRRIFEAPTVAELASQVEASRARPAIVGGWQIRSASREAPIPLSFAQERLWVLDQLEPGQTAYTIPWALRLSGPLDVSVLTRSLGEIVGRHEALRTTFGTIDGRPVQVVQAPGTFTVAVTDLTSTPPEGRDVAAQRLAREESGRPFDLARGPLFRAMLIRLAADDYVLVLTMHHIVADGWSFGVIARELSQLYEALVEGRPSPLAPLPIQYADYAVWQRQWLQGDELEARLTYWVEQLRGAPAELELMTARARPSRRSHEGAVLAARLAPATGDALGRLARQDGATLFMTLLAAFTALLHRHSGQDDLVVGTPIAGRTRVETEPLVGFFLNTLALRTNVSGNPTFRELLGRVKDVSLGAYAHQDLPFERLVETLAPERDLARSPIFQVFFNLLNMEEGSKTLQLPGVTVSQIGAQGPAESKFDLALYAQERPEGIELALTYSTDLLDAAVTERMLDDLVELIDRAAATPDARLSDLLLLDVRGANRAHPTNPFPSFPVSALDGSLPARFEEQVAKYPERVALITRGGAWTYAELNRVANRIAHAILARRGPVEERIALLFSHDEGMIAAVLGALKAGKTYVPLDPAYPRDRLAYIVEDAQASAVLTSRRHRALARTLTADELPVIDVDDIGSSVSEEDPGLVVEPDTLAYLLYTSGSTGRPKGVMQSHRNVLYFIRTYTHSLHLAPEDRLSLFSSYSFDAAVMDIFGALLNGATLCPWDPTVEDFAGLGSWLAARGITVFHSTPTLYRTFVRGRSATETFPSVRLVVMGGEEVSRDDVERFKTHFSPECLFVNGLGPTESTLALQFFVDRKTDVARNRVPVGYPVDGTEVVLLDAQGGEGAVVGEIAIRSPHVALGYWRRPELTRSAFLTAGGARGPRTYRTGDLGRRLPDGSFEFCGRKDFQVKVRGHRVELGEVEAVLGSHPAVKDQAVTVREEALGGGRLVAYVSLRADHVVSDDDLRRFLTDRLPAYMVPSAIVRLATLPLTPSGKVDRRALPDPEPERPGEPRSLVPPRTDVERDLAAIWRDVLRLAEIGIHDSFFALGGHSLHAVQVTARIRDRFGVSLPLRRVFEGPTIAELGVAIAQAKAELQSADELSRFLEELEGLSDVEVQTRLASGASDGTRDARE